MPAPPPSTSHRFLCQLNRFRARHIIAMWVICALVLATIDAHTDSWILQVFVAIPIAVVATGVLIGWIIARIRLR